MRHLQKLKCESCRADLRKTHGAGKEKGPGISARAFGSLSLRRFKRWRGGRRAIAVLRGLPGLLALAGKFRLKRED